MRRCVVYIRVTDTALTFDLKVNCIVVFFHDFVLGPQLFCP